MTPEVQLHADISTGPIRCVEVGEPMDGFSVIAEFRLSSHQHLPMRPFVDSSRLPPFLDFGNTLAPLLTPVIW